MGDMHAEEFKVYRDADELAAKAAVAVARAAGESIRHRGQFTLVLAGGSTPRRAYELLAAGEGEDSIDWSRVFLFFGDERHVPQDDPRSNYHMVHEALLTVARIANDQVIAVDTSLTTAAASADDYGQRVARFFALREGSMPIFDLILLGLGDDGHTASLFPGAAALQVNDRIAASSPPGVLPPPVDRITLTYPVLNAAREVLFLVSGANKAEALADLRSGHADRSLRPAAGVHPKDGRLTWMVDQAAASKLNSL